MSKLHFPTRRLLPPLTALSLLSSVTAIAQQDLPEIVVTATRVPIPVEQSGSAITVITREDLEQRQIRVVADALRDVPGATVSRSGGAGGITEVYLRGAESNQTLVLIDGVEVNNPEGGAFDFSSLLDLEVERIEVLRGPQSVLWGSSAMGGVINIITRRADQPLQASAQIEGGSFSTGQGSASLGTHGDRYDALLSGSWLKTDGWSSGSSWRGNSEDDGLRVGTVMFKGGLRPRDDLELNLIERYTDSRSDFDAFLGGDIRPVVDSDERADNHQNLLRLQGKFTMLEGAWEHLLGASRYDLNSSTLNTGVETFDSKSHSNQFDYQSNYFFNTADADHTLTFLVKNKEDVASNTYFARNSIRNTGVGLHYDIGLSERLFLTAGARHDFNDRFDDSNTYRLTAAYLWPDIGGRLHTSYGTATKNPTLTELFGFSGDFQGNPDLQPEKSHGYDLGWEQTLFDQRLRLDLSVFDNRIDNIIVGAGHSVINQPGESTSRGAELSANADLSTDLSATLAYAYTHTEDPQGQELSRRPRHRASLNLNYRALENRADFNLAVRYSGTATDLAYDSETFASFPVKLDSFTVVNLAARYQVDDHWRVFGRIDNVFNKEYEEVFGYSGVDRGVYLGARYQF